MKRFKIFILLGAIFFLTSCSFNEQNLEDATIYTTIYPVKFITEYLYGEDSREVTSIYPADANLNDYTLTDKQVEEYSKGDLFVYMGVGNEKEIAKSLINKNNKLLIIDATYGLNYNNNIQELWLAPNNFLMLAKNIKTSLQEYLNNPLKEEEVEKKYNKLYEEVSWIDAELRNISKEAKNNNNNTLVIASNELKYLEKFGFEIVSLEDISESNSENVLNDIKNKFKNSKYNAIIKLKSVDKSELVQDLEKNYKASIIEINDLITNTDTANDYITIQYENISAIRNLLIK